ncbi:hypothetical protein PR048_008939 [Dryococelus australis]|uniref:Uncharacterized protein n=1 Tax=Dryococelus australis TaxID=614101 RepID=A0ABQ9HYI2_9NEOP|nr:hypothetical protein PR048_008939 [Dryococelus australis]
MEKTISLKIEKFGILIDQKVPYFSVKPIGLKITFWNIGKDNTKITGMNTNDKHLFQVQGQLRIKTSEKFYTIKHESKEVTSRSDEFCKTAMEEKLSRFYMDCVLPEVHPRQRRSMPIRNPTYIRNAQ